MFLAETWYRVDALIIVFVFLLVLLLAAELGFREGFKRSARTRKGQSELVQPQLVQPELVQQGMMTLLALLLAFGVSMAELRYEERNSVLIEEATSIGTTYLRASLFSESFGKIFQDLLKRYMDVRIEWYRFGYQDQGIEQNLQKTTELQNALWTEARLLSRDRPTITMSLLLQSLNETIDIQSKQAFAYNRRVPRVIVYLLFLVSTMVVVLVGYSHGISGRRHLTLTTMMSLILAMTLFVILDLSRPERGLIRLNPQVLVDLRKSLEGK
jgi:hypothetical protein